MLWRPKLNKKSPKLFKEQFHIHNVNEYSSESFHTFSAKFWAKNLIKVYIKIEVSSDIHFSLYVMVMIQFWFTE